jgi:hypothetical protein
MTLQVRKAAPALATLVSALFVSRTPDIGPVAQSTPQPDAVNRLSWHSMTYGPNTASASCAIIGGTLRTVENVHPFLGVK